MGNLYHRSFGRYIPPEFYSTGFRLSSIVLLLAILFSSNTVAQVKLQNYGVVSGHASGKLTGSSVTATVSIGQPVTALNIYSSQNSITAGIFGFYLLPPDTPSVVATQGDFPDRVELTWSFHPLSAPADVDFYQIYRDGNLLASVPATQMFYKDYNVLPGNYYEYKVIGQNEFGQSPAGMSVGFINPNGTITGRILTTYKVPVNDVEVTITPNLGKSFQFNGFSNYIDAGSKLNLKDTSFTIEFWLKRAANSFGPILSHNTHDTGTDSQLVIGFNNSGQFYVATNTANPITFPVIEDSLWHHYAWVYNELKDSGYLYRDGVLKHSFPAEPYKGSGLLLFGKSGDNFMNMHLDEVRIWNVVKDSLTLQRNLQRTVNTNSSGLIAYWKFDEGKGNRVFDFATKTNTGIVYGPLNFADDRAPVRSTAFTDSTGFFIAEGINYGTSTNFTVSPVKPLRTFNPSFKILTLSASNTAVNNVDFSDESQLGVSGLITHAGTSCLSDTTIEVLVDGKSWNPRVFTDKDGKYTIGFDPQSTHTITPYKPGYSFSPAKYDVVSILNPISGVNFSQVQKFSVKVVVAGGRCELPIGSSKIRITSLPMCYSDSVVTDSTGIFTFTNLPPLLYKVEALRTDGIMFEAQRIDLRDTNVIKDNNRAVRFIYHSPLVVQIDSSLLPTVGACSTVVLKQLYKYQFKYKVGEVYGSGFCPADSGTTITVNNEIGDESPRTITISDWSGTVTDEIIAGYPNILSGGAHPYQKQLLVTAKDPLNRQAQSTYWALVTGVKPRAGQTFVTRSPEIPTMILRDPPGNQSFSYWMSSKTTATEISMTVDSALWKDHEVFASLAPKVEAEVFGVTMEIKPVVEATVNWTTGVGNTRTRGLRIENTAIETIQTEDFGQIPAHKGDVFIGSAYNFVFGKTNTISFDATTCQVVSDTGIIAAPDSVATKFVYTEDHIRNVLIPTLYSHYYNSRGSDSAAVRMKDTVAIINWERILAYNDSVKAAIYPSAQNISFAAGAAVSQSRSINTISTQELHLIQYVDSTNMLKLGLLFNDFGGTYGWSKLPNIHVGTDSMVHTDTTIYTETGFTLSDADNGDYFSVNVAIDSVYKTPIFQTVAGASSCPWEPGTLARDSAVFSPRSVAAVNVQPDSAAAFVLGLGNATSTNETRDYVLKVVNATNIGGAQIAINGVTIENQMLFSLPPGLTQTILTVKRGPYAFEYDNINLILSPACTDDPALPLSDTLYVSAHFLKPCSPVTISQPQQNWLVNENNRDSLPVTITGYNRTNLGSIKLQYRSIVTGMEQAMKNPFVAQYARFNNDGKIIKLDLSSLPAKPLRNFSGVISAALKDTDWYDASREDRSGLISPYRTNPVIKPQSGMAKNSAKAGKKQAAVKEEAENTITPAKQNETGTEGTLDSWTTFATLAADSLRGATSTVNWLTAGLDDGTYEIRAVSKCDGSSIDGNSVSMMGIVDRTGPYVMGVPSPASGILGTNDQIAITFTKPLQVSSITTANNVKLYYSETGAPIEINFACDGRTIVLMPTVANRFIENKILRAVVTKVKDTHGNLMRVPFGSTFTDSISWEFVVQKSPVRWSGGDITVVKYPDEAIQITRQLVNSGGFSNPYYLKNLPNWLSVSSTQGIVPNQGNVPITFTFGTGVPYGNNEVVITDSTVYGDQPLRIRVQVACRPPNWQVSAANYQYSMNIVGRLFLDSVAIVSTNSRIGVFAGQELRGMGQLKKLNNSTYRVFLTVYSNVESGEPLQMRVWDSTGCNEYAQILEQYTFSANTVLGTINDPVSITATNMMFQKYDVNSGWTWLSFNTKAADMSVSKVLATLTATPNDIIKDQTSFAQYVNNDIWVGSLDTIRNTKMYLLKSAKKDSLTHVGFAIQPVNNPIIVKPGWNYIGYIPQTAMDVNSALSSINAHNGDLLKSQFTFVMYDSVFGWVGDLSYMQPKLGYFIKLSTQDTLIYPTTVSSPNRSLLALDNTVKTVYNHPDWQVMVNQYQYSMTMIARLGEGVVDSVGADTYLGLFKGNECRGYATAKYSEISQGNVFYLTVYGNNADTLTIRVLQGSGGAEQLIAGKIVFEADKQSGTLRNPYLLDGTVTGVENNSVLPIAFALGQNYPNPFNPSTTIRYAVPYEADIEITLYNIMGEKVKQLVKEHKTAGYYQVVWDGRNEFSDVVSSGVYIYSMKAGSYQSTRKLTFLK